MLKKLNRKLSSGSKVNSNYILMYICMLVCTYEDTKSNCIIVSEQEKFKPKMNPFCYAAIPASSTFRQ